MTALAAEDPVHVFIPSYLGPRGWVALALDVEPVGWDRVERLVTTSYRLVAPKTLARTV